MNATLSSRLGPVFVLAFFAGAAPAQEKVFPKAALDVLKKAEQFEIYSLDGDGKAFRGYAVLGKADVKDEKTRQKIVAALVKGVEDVKKNVTSAARYPRFGLRATADKITVDLIFEFNAEWYEYWIGDKHYFQRPTTAVAEPIFEEILREAKVPLAKKRP